MQDPDHGWVTAYGRTCDVEYLPNVEEKSPAPLCSSSLPESLPASNKRAKSRVVESEKALLRECSRFSAYPLWKFYANDIVTLAYGTYYILDVGFAVFTVLIFSVERP